MQSEHGGLHLSVDAIYTISLLMIKLEGSAILTRFIYRGITTFKHSLPRIGYES